LSFKGYFVRCNYTGGTRAGEYGERFIRYGLLESAVIIGMTNEGTFLAIEVKRPSGKISPYQNVFLEQIRAKNDIAIVAYSLTDAEEVL
jgi:hypothetical protein